MAQKREDVGDMVDRPSTSTEQLVDDTVRALGLASTSKPSTKKVRFNLEDELADLPSSIALPSTVWTRPPGNMSRPYRSLEMDAGVMSPTGPILHYLDEEELIDDDILLIDELEIPCFARRQHLLKLLTSLIVVVVLHQDQSNCIVSLYTPTRQISVIFVAGYTVRMGCHETTTRGRLHRRAPKIRRDCARHEPEHSEDRF